MCLVELGIDFAESSDEAKGNGCGSMSERTESSAGKGEDPSLDFVEDGRVGR